MARDKSLKHGSSSDAFAEGAARFAELAQAVKARQAAELKGMPGSDAFTQPPSPCEVWASKYMCCAVGPSGTDATVSMAPVPHAMAMAPDFSELKRSYKPADVTRGVGARLDLKPAPMAGRLGRDERPRRSWLVRLWKGG